MSRIHNKKALDQFLGHVADVVPVGRGELESTLFNQLKQSLVVLVVEGWETTKPNKEKYSVNISIFLTALKWSVVGVRLSEISMSS